MSKVGSVQYNHSLHGDHFSFLSFFHGFWAGESPRNVLLSQTLRANIAYPLPHILNLVVGADNISVRLLIPILMLRHTRFHFDTLKYSLNL